MTNKDKNEVRRPRRNPASASGRHRRVFCPTAHPRARTHTHPPTHTQKNREHKITPIVCFPPFNY